MLDVIIDRAGFFIAGGITSIVVLLWAGYLFAKRAYRKAARGW